jgi:hypothetical protein
MLSKWHHLKEEAMELRKKGNSIPCIARDLGIPRSTLSCWLKNIVLTDEQKAVLKDKEILGLIKARKGAVKYHNNLKKERLILAEKQANETFSRIDSANIDIAELAFAMLYLGEGSKGNTTSMGNSDPMILKFFIRILIDKYNVSIEKIRCELHLRADQNWEDMKKYWSDALNIPLVNFMTVAFDKRTIGRPTYDNYKGVCVVRCGTVAIQRKLVYLSRLYCSNIINGSIALK